LFSPGEIDVTTSHATTVDACPVRDVIERVGEKWSVMLIMRLSDGATRFGELTRTIEGISRNMLTRSLRQLERDGLVHREVVPTTPPKVVYSLTPLGESLVVPLDQLTTWAFDHGEEVRRARRTFDQRPPVDG
jgi:DNA-binding HxlR family transcriptional regulator